MSERSRRVFKTYSNEKNLFLSAILVTIIMAIFLKTDGRHVKDRHINRRAATKKFCLNVDKTLRARHKACFLRADTGPCRADILQWYYDVKARSCYRFFWGGCQGNGNRFESKEQCHNYCYLNTSNVKKEVPNFCQLDFDYGTCFGHYNRWTYDKFAKSCRRRLYSGCGGNQNNFQTKDECFATCVIPPRNTMDAHIEMTTCIPLDIEDFRA